MLETDVLSLIPGGMFGQGSAAEQHMPASALPGGNVSISPSGQVGALNRQSEQGGAYGNKFPLAAIPKTEQGIQDVRGIKQAEGDANPFFKFLGIGGTWKDVGVYSILVVLFIVGVIGLLFAAGAAGPPSSEFKDRVKTVVKREGRIARLRLRGMKVTRE